MQKYKKLVYNKKERSDNIMKKKTGIIGALVGGTIIGATAGVLLAPKSGKETRKDIVKKAKKITNKVKTLEIEDIKTYITEKVAEIEKYLKNLEKEKDAKRKITKIQKEVKKLGDNIKDNAEETYQNMVNGLKEKVDEVSKKIDTK